MNYVLILVLAAAVTSSAQDCGRSKAGNWRVTNGVNAERGAWPWLASLDFPDGRHNCGGTIINQQWILTAAHCVVGGLYDADEIHIRLGKHRLDKQEEGQIDTVASKVIPHPEYDWSRTTSPNDIALIKLAAPLVYSASVQPVCLTGHEEAVLDPGSCVVSGWGVTQSSQDQNILQEVRGPAITHEEGKTDAKRCGVFWQQYFTKNHLCFGGEGSAIGACNGDSGGPLVCMKDGRYVQYGVVTFGFARYCNAPGFESLYTRVPAFIQWINDTIEQN